MQIDRVLRCRKTKQYYTGEGWSGNTASALTFPNQLEAVMTSQMRNLHDVDLVLFLQDMKDEVFCARVR